MSVYAVKIGDKWRIAKKAKASDYSLSEHPDLDVWCEAETTAWLGYVGNGEQVVELEAGK